MKSYLNQSPIFSSQNIHIL